MLNNVFFIKSGKPFAEEAAKLFLEEVPSTIVGTENNNLRQFDWPSFDFHDYMISYIGPWVIPKEMLNMVRLAAINFHPGPPEYPGIGCTNFALYNEEKDFGITVHHMEPKVDSGEIIMVKRFPVVESDTVWTLSQKCYAYIFVAFCELLPLFGGGDSMRNLSREEWKREPYTRKQLNELCRITEDMSDEEVKRRVKATTYPNMPGA